MLLNQCRQLYHTRNIGVRNSTFKSHVFPTKTKSLPSCHRNHHASTSTFGASYYGSHEFCFENPLRYQASLPFQWVFMVNFCWFATIHPRVMPKLRQQKQLNSQTLTKSMGFIVFTDTFTREKTIHLSTNTTHKNEYLGYLSWASWSCQADSHL